MTVAPLIHIADGQSDEILGDIAPEYIIDDTHRQSLEDTLETYEFYTFADQPFTQHLKDRNRIIIPDEDGTLREFIIYESEKYRDTEGYKMYVIGTASYLDLKKANVIRPGSFTGTASQHIGIALNDTEWRPGIVEVSGSRTLHRENFTNPFDYLKTLAREFEGELRFRIEHNGNRITGRFVDLLERIGEWRGREIEFGKDLDGIRRIENTERIVTALIGLGPERDDGTRLEVFVEDTEALQRWGRPDPVTGELRHLIEVYEPESEREDMTEAELRQYTRTELNKRINAVVTYECSVVDLENVPGMENKQIRFGDTIKIKDTKFNPPLYIEARVFEQERSIKNKAKKDIKLGDYVEYTEEEVQAIWNQLRNEIRRRLDRMAIVTINSTSGNIFKNAQGETQLTARTFVNGAERDEDGTLYDYQWMRFDKDGNHDTDFYAEGKTITVKASDIDEKATYRVLVAYELEVINTAEITIFNVFDGEDGEPGPPGKDGQTTYTWVKYADDDKGSGMSDSPDGKLYIGLAFNKTTPQESNNPADYTWSLMPQNIEVGGRNLALVTGLQIVASNLGDASNRGEQVDERTFKIYANPPAHGISFLFGYAEVSQGKEYILNADMSDTISSVAGVIVYDENKNILEEDGLLSGDLMWTPAYRGYHQYSSEVVKTPLRFKVEDSRVKFVRLRLGIYDRRFINRDVLIRDPELREGNKTLGWTPAPEDVQEQIDEAKQTADGKNSVFTQPSAPPTTGRKIGDVWFDTSRGNLMHRFDGTKWVEAKWGEQSIVANSITANHIKSLVGLNVNNQFIVDSNGNVRFAGRLEGAMGSFKSEGSDDKAEIESGRITIDGSESKTEIDHFGLTSFDKLNNYVTRYGNGTIRVAYGDDDAFISLSPYLIYIRADDGGVSIETEFINLIAKDIYLEGDIYIATFDTPLWTGTRYPTDASAQTVYPSRPLSQCMTGWILRWQYFAPGSGTQNQQFQYTHIPKAHLQAGARGMRIPLQRAGGENITKYIYVYDNRIEGHADNGVSPNNTIALTGVFEY